MSAADSSYTGPTGIVKTDSTLHIEGYPDAERVVRLTSKCAQRLADLRLHQSSLHFAEEAMQEFGKVRASSSLAAEAMLVGVITKFFSCFGQNEGASPLSADRVFKGMPDAKACFVYWKALRDKHITHNENTMTSLETGLVLGPDAEIQDVISLLTAPRLSEDDRHCQLLYDLIAHTLQHVVTEIDAILPRLFEEAQR